MEQWDATPSLKMKNGVCSNMRSTRADLTKRSQRHIPCDITYMCYLKYGTNEPVCRIETDSQTWRTGLWWPRGLGTGWTGSLGLVDANCDRMDGQQGPTI